MRLTKQPSLKPQDVVVLVKLALVREAVPAFAKLGADLHISPSEVHAGVRRAGASRLVDSIEGELRVNRKSLQEFLIHGVKYAFPAVEGPIVRGLATGASAPVLSSYFEQADLFPTVWPHSNGRVRGQSICPLYPTVPAACQEDEALYAALSALDAIRGGAARERELAQTILARMLL